jgi:hypothetical protein
MIISLQKLAAEMGAYEPSGSGDQTYHDEILFLSILFNQTKAFFFSPAGNMD